MLSALVPAALPASALPASLAAHPWHGGGPGPGGPGWWIVFPIFWFLVFASIVLFVVRGARRGWRHAGPGGSYGPPWARGNSTAIAVLGERYARGEIDEVEYRARLEVLTRQV